MKLRTGDRVYATINGKIQSVYQIERTTETQAICGNIRFKIEYNDGWVDQIGQAKWDINCFYAETPELRAQLMHQNAVAKVSKILFSTLSIEQLTEMIKIASK